VAGMPAIQLLESTHQFPGCYMFKVIGRSEHAFAARVVAAVRDALAEEADPPFKVRETAGGRHVAVTLTPTVKSAQQVLDVYQRIQKMAGLVMVW
jgi:uncharacterized protein